jgi:hypothetical protein
MDRVLRILLDEAYNLTRMDNMWALRHASVRVSVDLYSWADIHLILVVTSRLGKLYNGRKATVRMRLQAIGPF